MAPRPGRGGQGGSVGSFFVVLGCLAVLGVTFLLGVVVGRVWPSLPAFRSATVAKPSRERGREREARASETPPTLTFYQELTAPLTSPPAARPLPPRAEAPRAEAPKAPAREAPKAAAPEAPALGGFTVQVGAYKTREPAEALRARLVAAGHDAYVVETDEAAVHFRVRVGAFATREDAQAAAARIADGHTFSTFVTAR